MNAERIAELRAIIAGATDGTGTEDLSYGELVEIQSACDAAGIETDAIEGDPMPLEVQLDELEARLDDCPPQGIAGPVIHEYNVMMTVIGLVYAESEDEAEAIMGKSLRDSGYDTDNTSVFHSDDCDCDPTAYNLPAWVSVRCDETGVRGTQCIHYTEFPGGHDADCEFEL